MMLSNQEKLELSKLVIATAKLYNTSLDADVVRLVVEDLEDISLVKLKNAFFEYRRDSKNKFWPKASDIRAIVFPEADSKEAAIELAYKIDKAIGKFGYNWQDGQMQNGNVYYLGGGVLHHTFKDAVIAELGPLGWHAICARGGWMNVRNSANTMAEGTFIAQMRDQIQASHSLQKKGIDITQIEMPSKQKIEHRENSNLIAINFKNSEEEF